MGKPFLEKLLLGQESELGAILVSLLFHNKKNLFLKNDVNFLYSPAFTWN
jgi:hypothetical protein